MDNTTLASEIIAEQESRLRTVMDDLGMSRFIMGELLSIVDEPVNNEKEVAEYAYDQSRIERFTCIAIDYLARAQRTIEDTIQREKTGGRQKWK